MSIFGQGRNGGIFGVDATASPFAGPRSVLAPATWRPSPWHVERLGITAGGGPRTGYFVTDDAAFARWRMPSREYDMMRNVVMPSLGLEGLGALVARADIRNFDDLRDYAVDGQRRSLDGRARYPAQAGAWQRAYDEYTKIKGWIEWDVAHPPEGAWEKDEWDRKISDLKQSLYYADQLAQVAAAASAVVAAATPTPGVPVGPVPGPPPYGVPTAPVPLAPLAPGVPAFLAELGTTGKVVLGAAVVLVGYAVLGRKRTRRRARGRARRRRR